jgi:hypothetical protein
MLIKWENFGAFLSWLLRREIFLIGDVLSQFHHTSLNLHEGRRIHKLLKQKCIKSSTCIMSLQKLASIRATYANGYELQAVMSASGKQTDSTNDDYLMPQHWLN